MKPFLLLFLLLTGFPGGISAWAQTTSSANDSAESDLIPEDSTEIDSAGFDFTGIDSLQLEPSQMDLSTMDSMRLDSSRIDSAGLESADIDSVKNCEPKDIGDLFRKKSKPPKRIKSFSALVLPSISSNPTNGLVLGVGGVFSWFMGPRDLTRVSTAPFQVAVTSRNQLISFVKPNIYLKDNKYFLQGDWRFYLYSQPTFGLGTNSPDTINIPNSIHWQGDSRGVDTLAFDMNFNYLKIHEVVNREIRENVFLGLGYHLDYYYQIEDLDLNLQADPVLLTPYYVYNRQFGYDSSRSLLSGLSLNAVYDSRDNMANPYKGFYVNLNYRYNFEALGSDQNSSTLWTEFRTYVGLSRRHERHLLAFWLIGSFTVTGDLPYLNLPAIGDDQRTRAGRGYVNGRFRGKNYVYGEVEWRFPILPCSEILGGVIFVNAITADNPRVGVSLFDSVRPAVGVGLRFMLNKSFRTNINVDFAAGEKSGGLYFAGQETF